MGIKYKDNNSEWQDISNTETDPTINARLTASESALTALTTRMSTAETNITKLKTEGQIVNGTWTNGIMPLFPNAMNLGTVKVNKGKWLFIASGRHDDGNVGFMGWSTSATSSPWHTSFCAPTPNTGRGGFNCIQPIDITADNTTVYLRATTVGDNGVTNSQAVFMGVICAIKIGAL